MLKVIKIPLISMTYGKSDGLDLFCVEEIRRMVAGLVIISLCMVCFVGAARASSRAETVQQVIKIGRSTGLPIPRFVSLKKSEANMRVGPGEAYAVKWVFQRQHLPVEIIGEHGLWRQVRDRAGDEGWIHTSMLAGRRYAVVTGEQATLFKRPGNTAYKVVAYGEVNLVVRLLSCSPGWCRVEVKGYKGWVDRRKLWGLYPEEIFD